MIAWSLLLLIPIFYLEFIKDVDKASNYSSRGEKRYQGQFNFNHS